ncbi:E3 UFM1-protein ligase 1 [Galdieria sulphuraria]|nr:E3 UFM1-protein ligase 1 [Galdieria sulphuraria]
MSTKVLNVLENRGSKKYKFLKKKDRLNLVNIGEYRPWTEPVRQEKLKKPNFTFFREALDYWSELDVSADFVSFRQKTNLYGHSLSLLLAKRRRTVKLLLNRLRKRPRTIAFQSLCGCLLAFVRDIRHRFVEYIPVTWKVLSEFMDFESEEIMSCIFSTLNSLGKILWEPMLKQFPKTWNLWKPFIVHKTSQVRVLAAQCFGFVLRKGIVEDMLPNMITQIFQEVTVPSLESIKCREMLQRTVDGVCESFIQILVSPIGKQLLSKSDLVLKTLLQQAFMDNECFACSGFFVLQQLFVKILKQIPYSGTQWLFVHLLDFLKYDLLSNEVVIVNNIENKSSCRFPYFLSICLMGFCCLNDFSHVITIDNIWNAFQSILQMTDIITESYVMDAFSYSCLFYSLENLLLLLANEDASQLNILWKNDCIYILSFEAYQYFCHNSLYLYWERFKVCPENELYWQVLLALCKQHVEIDVGIDVIQQLFTSALSYLSNHTSEMSLFRSLLDICCEIRNDRMLREWESFLEKYYLKNGQVDSSSKWLMSRVCSKMLISGCSLSSWFHEWIQELVFLEDEVEMQVLRASLISLQTHGVLCKKTRVSFNLKEIAPNHLLKCLLFASIKKRQVVLELLSTIGKWVEWKDCSVFELIFAVENVPKIPTYVSESLLKTQRVIDYLQYQRKGLTSIADSSPVMYVLCFETLTWLRCELSPVQPNIYEIWKHLCRLCPNAVLFAVKQVLSMDLSQITKEPRTLEEHISSVMCTEHSQIQNAIFQWIQLNQKHFKSFIFYYEALKSLLENGQNSNDSKVMEFSDIIESECKEKDWLDERMNFNSWHIQLLKAIEATLPDSEIIALHLLKSFFMIVVGRNAAKNAFAEWSFKLMERYLSLFLCCHKEQHRLTTFAEWVKDNYQAIEDRLLSVIVSGKGNTQQLALSCQVRCMQPFLSSYETWLIRLQSSKHFKDVYTHFFAALFQNVSIQMLGTSESSLSIQTSHLVEIKKLVLQILLGKLNDITEKAKLETNVLTLLSGFREPDDVNLLWRLLWQPLLDCMGLDQVEEVLERIDDIPWNDKLRFSGALVVYTVLKMEMSLWRVTKELDINFEFMISNIFDWLRNMRSTLEAYRPNDGQTPAMLIALDKITSCEPLTFRIMENQHLCECCIELMLKFIRYYRQNEDTLFYCVSIWKHLFSVAQDNNICLSCLEGKSKREEIWLSLTNNIFRIWDTIKRPGKSHSRKLQSLDALLEMMLQFDYHQSVTTGIDKQLQSPFEKLLKHIVSTLGNIHYWKHASHVAEKSKDLMALYIQRMDGQKWLSHLICSKLAYILFELNTVILEDHCVIEKVDQMLLELCKCLAEKLSESWLNVVSEHLPDMLCIVNENGKDCIEIERRVNALEVVVSNLESLLDLTTEHSVEGLFVSNERDCPPSYIPLLLLSYACFRNIVLEDLSLCILAGRGLKAVGRFLISQLAKNVSDSSMQYDIVLQQLVESCNVLLFSHSSFGIQRVLFMTIGTWVYTWYSICSDSSRRTIQIPCLECFFPMISSSLSNIEESWFANMVHLQLHRRCRACLEISRKVDVCQPFANILMKFAISWTFQRCLESINATRNGTMERWYQVMSILVDTSVQKMAWQDYKHFLERILKKWIHMKNCMHPTSKKEWNLWIKLGEIFISSLPKWIELEKKNRKELYLGRDTNDDGDIHESQQSGVVYDPYQNYMEERLIPLIARVLKELSYSSISIEEKKYSRITPQFADLLIRALHSLDDSQREKYVNEIIRYLTSQIRSKSQRQRELARNCFCTMLKHWGVSYMRRIYDATKATCQDGFRVYVLRYSIFYYVKCLAENNMIIQDADLVREWMNIFQEEISSLVDDQENRIPYQECKEVSSFYIHDALTLLAKIAQGKESWDLWKYFLTSCCRLNGVKNPSRKKQLVRNFFPHLVKSLLSCPDLNQALWFVYALMKEKQPLTGKDGQKEEKLSLEESSILLLEFALQLLYRLLKRLNSQVNPTQYEDVLKTFFPMVNQLFRTKNEFLCSYSLRVIQLLWKVTALPRTPKHWNDIFQYASSLLSNVSRLDGTGSSSNGALVHAAIRTLSTIITKLPANGHKNKSWQEEYIIPLIRIMQQIFSSVSVDWMPSLLHLIRVFVKHRLGFRAPEMFSLMNTLSQMAIQSSEKAVREAIVSIWIDFILHYPIPESVFHEYVQYFVSNLQYPYSFGRQASANILSKWLLESSTSPIWKEKEISLFVATSAQKANEEDLQVRQTFSNLLITLFSCMDEQRRVYVLEMIEEWSSNEKKELQLFAIVVVECLCDISNLRKSELALLLKISGKCLQSMSLQFSSLEATDVHFAFGALLSCLERILKHRPDWIVRESFLDIYKCMWKYELFATNTLSVRRKLDSLIASLSLSLETLNGVLERKAEHLLLLNAEDTFLATLLNCCIDHLSVDPLADDTAKLLSENINRLLNWMEKFRSNDIRKSTVEHISLDCLMKLSKIASGPNLPSDTFGTFRRQIALELVRDRLKVAHSIWSTNVSTEESYARPLIRLMLRCWRDFGEPQRQQLNRKRKKKSLKTSLDETETIQLVLQDIECLLSSRMSSSYHTLLNNMREEYIQRRKARKLKK